MHSGSKTEVDYNPSVKRCVVFVMFLRGNVFRKSCLNRNLWFGGFFFFFQIVSEKVAAQKVWELQCKTISFDDVHYHHPSCFVSRIVQNIANIFTIYKCLFSQMIFVQYQQ